MGVLCIATIFPRGEDLNDQNEVITHVKEFNEMLTSYHVRTYRDFEIKKVDGHNLKWRIVDMTDIFVYEKMKEEKYFCQKNHGRKEKDFIHFNKNYLNAFYRRLDQEIQNYRKRRQKHRKSENEKK